MRSVPEFLLPVLVCLFAAGCGRPETKPTAPKAASHVWSTEAQYVVESTVSRLAEMVAFAKTKEPLPEGSVGVEAKERVDSPMDQPVYDLEIQPGKGHAPLKLTLTVSQPIWAPELYQEAATELLKSWSLSPAASASAASGGGTALLAKLTDWTAAGLEQENLRISKALQEQPANAALHQQAALVLGVFGLREHAGDFTDVRPALCRMSSHLALARAWTGGAPKSVEGQLAEAILYVLMNDQAEALTKISALPQEADLAPWVRSLKPRCTRDYRELAGLKQPTMLEKVALFQARAQSLSVDLGWEQLDEKEVLACPDFVRIGSEEGYSVQVGHVITRLGLAINLHELDQVYPLAVGHALDRKKAVALMNELPGGYAVRIESGKAQVRVIDWGLWAGLLQRQICHAAQQGYTFIQSKWGVKEEAEKFAREADQTFGELRLFPFVRRMNCASPRQYREAIDDGVAVTASRPELVAPVCWNYLLVPVSFTELYSPTGVDRGDQWFRHNPLPGTALSLRGRLVQKGVRNQPDTVARLEALHRLAPYDTVVDYELIERKYGRNGTAKQLQEIYQPILEYALVANTRVANAAYRDPAQYEKFMGKAAELEPARYFDLGQFFVQHGNEEKAAEYYKKAVWLCRDDVRVSNQADWLVKYFFRKGQLTDADKLADRCAETYSARGLRTKADLLFLENHYTESFEYIRKMDERYQTPLDVVGWCQEYKHQTGDAQYDEEIQKRFKDFFPYGLEKAGLADFNGPVEYGVEYLEENPTLLGAGMKRGDVIVALDGIRVWDRYQYTYLRDLTNSPNMGFIVWTGTNYAERAATLPKREFGVRIQSYNHPKPKR